MRVLNRVTNWWDHAKAHSSSEFPLLEAAKYLLMQEAHITYCIRQATDMVTLIESRLQPVLEMKIPQVYLTPCDCYNYVKCVSHFWLRILHLWHAGRVQLAACPGDENVHISRTMTVTLLSYFWLRTLQ
jgi:hypothetical protein